MYSVSTVEYLPTLPWTEKGHSGDSSVESLPPRQRCVSSESESCPRVRPEVHLASGSGRTPYSNFGGCLRVHEDHQRTDIVSVEEGIKVLLHFLRVLDDAFHLSLDLVFIPGLKFLAMV